MRFFRDDALDYLDSNSILGLDFNWYVTDRLVFTIGGELYHRQLNGIIPFLYNEYTQTTFDHTYGRMNLGIAYLFGGSSSK